MPMSVSLYMSMSRRFSSGWLALALATLSLSPACGEEDGEAKKIGESQGSWTVYAMPYTADPARANPISGTIAGRAEVFDVGGKTKVRLDLSGLPTARKFGSHVHRAACDDNKAGTHYQHTPAPPDGSVTDPSYANVHNEIWLDFSTDAAGKATVERTVDFKIEGARAKAVVIHDMETNPNDGTAGPKLACINLTVN